eukprot:gene27732-34499_t
MGPLGFSWAHLQYDSRKVVRNILLEQAKGMSAFGITSVLSGVAHMGIRLSDLTPAMHKSVQFLFFLVMKENAVIAIAESLEALALMGFRWGDLVPKLTTRLDALLASDNYEESQKARIRVCLDNLTAKMTAGNKYW